MTHTELLHSNPVSTPTRSAEVALEASVGSALEHRLDVLAGVQRSNYLKRSLVVPLDEPGVRGLRGVMTSRPLSLSRLSTLARGPRVQ